MRDHTPRVPALILGPGNLALGALRVLGRGGIPAYAAATDPGIETASRWYRAAPGRWSGRDIRTDLSRCGLERAVLFPTSERYAAAAARLPPDLAARFPSSTPHPELIDVFADKERQTALLREHGVPVPRSWPLSSPRDLDAVSDEELANTFLKPKDSGRFSSVFGKKALRPEGREAMRHSVESARRAGFEMLLQEYVPGPPTSCYLIDGFIDRNAEPCGLFARRRVRQYPEDFGNSSAVCSVDATEVADMATLLFDFLRIVGYRGIFNAEFKRDPRDGSFRVLEINPRTWLYAEFAARCGFDALTMAYRDALELPVERCTGYDIGRTVVYPYYDLNALRAMRRRGEISFRAGLRSWVGADQLHFVRDDPRPGIVDTWRWTKRWADRRLRRLMPRRRAP